MPYVVYILRCADRSLYIGQTDDLDARLAKHNRGEGASFTTRRVPAVVAYTESFDGRVEAAARERQLKRWTRAKKEALIGGDLPLLKRL